MGERPSHGGAGSAEEQRLRLSVPEMDCASCAGKIETGVERTDGVTDVETHPTTGQVLVAGRADREAVVSAIERAGYAVDDADDGPDQTSPNAVWRSPRALATWIGALVLAIGLALRFVAPGLDAVAFVLAGRAFHASQLLFVASAALAGAPILRNGYYSVRTRNLDIDLLMGAGILGAVAAHHPFEGAMLAVLFSIAELLERFSMDRARDSLRELMDLSPEIATVRRDGEERTIPVKRVATGDRIVVRPGEKVPLDGVVVEGDSAVNQAPITGESVPVDKTDGDDVYAGTINEAGYLEVQVTSDANESTLARIIDAVEDAEREKTDREQFVDRFAAVYTPVVVVAALSVFVLPPLLAGGSWSTWFLRGLTLLVIACPCAFVISTPVSVVSGITSAARNGVLIKGGTHLEAMGETDVVALDKTGTLTAGELSVTDVVSLSADEEDVLRRARAIERRSEHPIAAAIAAHADRETGVPGEGSVADHTIENFESLTGEGVRADLDGVTHYAGKPDLFGDLGFDLRGTRLRSDGGLCRLPPERCERDCASLAGEIIPRFEREGKTIVLVGTEDELEGIIAIADEMRPGARRAISRLEDHAESVVMLTGDNEGTARAIAGEVGIDEYRADLLPEEKLTAIEDLEASHGAVAMVGDGINDAPALAAADVGIAMGAAGTDTALETADIALMGDDLSRLPYLARLSRGANGVIRQNIWSSLAVKAVLAIGAPFGIVTIVHAVVIGDMGMGLGVTGNAMRLSRLDPDD